jgi:hypothetical protein
MKRAGERGRDAPDAWKNAPERGVSLLSKPAGSGKAGARVGSTGSAQAIARRCRCFYAGLSGGNLPGVVPKRRLVAGAA